MIKVIINVMICANIILYLITMSLYYSLLDFKTLIVSVVFWWKSSGFIEQDRVRTEKQTSWQRSALIIRVH